MLPHIEKLAAQFTFYHRPGSLQILEWLIQMSLALDYLHRERVLHRDIKPHNVFLAEHGKIVKLGDFGFTTFLDNTNSMAQTRLGTPYYLSREFSHLISLPFIMFTFPSTNPAHILLITFIPCAYATFSPSPLV